MATPATHTPFLVNTPISIQLCDERTRNRINPNFDRTNSNNDYTIKFSSKEGNIEGRLNPNTELTTSKFFVKQLQKLLREYGLLKEYFPNISEVDLQNKLEPSLANFIEINSDAFSVELTKDETVFFTIIKKEFSFYIEQYLDGENESEQFILTAFKSKNLLVNKSGKKIDLINTINSIINN